MSLEPSCFRPPLLLRNRHVQSLLASSRLRRLAARQARARLQQGARELILNCGQGVRLQGFLTPQTAQAQARGLAVLLHGWEGRVDSNYVLHTGAHLLAAGFDVFRLHFRDHGDTHGLNRGLFHSALLDEVTGGILDLTRRTPHRTLCIAGYSLGGNFALRAALRAPAAGLTLAHVAAVCPVINPKAGLHAIETAPWFYEKYFLYKWARSLRRKQALYPDAYAFPEPELRSGVRDLTRMLVERHTDFASLDAYLEAYSIAEDRLAGLQVPSSILAAADDPIIPIDDFHHLQLPAHVQLCIAPFGGHCGFICDWRLNGFAERWVTERLCQATA